MGAVSPHRLSLDNSGLGTGCQRRIADDGNGLFSPRDTLMMDAARGPAFFLASRLQLPPDAHSSASGSPLLFLLPGLLSPAHPSLPPFFSFSRSSSRRPDP